MRPISQLISALLKCGAAIAALNDHPDLVVALELANTALDLAFMREDDDRPRFRNHDHADRGDEGVDEGDGDEHND